MMIKSKKISAGQVAEATMQLTYSVTPQEIYYTRDSLNPSVVQLTIGATNNTGADVSIAGIQVRIVVSGVPQDVLTDDPSTINPVSLQPDSWNFTRFDTGIYLASPLPAVVIPAKGTITFQLQNIVVNESAGTTVVTIVERNNSGFPEESFPINKIRSQLSVDSLDANPVMVSPGGTSTLSWATTAAARVTLLPGNPPSLPTTGSQGVTMTETTTYTLTAYGEGPNVSKQVTVTVAPVKIRSFTASSQQVNAGDPVTLSWTTENASYCAINPGPTNLPVNGSLQVNPYSDTVYTLTAYSLSGKMENAPITVQVNPVTISSFKATPDYGIAIGTPVNLSWNVTSTLGVNITPDIGQVNASGNRPVSPGSKTIYSIVAQGKQGPVSAQVTLLPMMTSWQMPTTNAPLTDNGKPVMLMKDTKMWLMAYGASSLVFSSDDGSSWNVAGTGPWIQRSGAGGAVLNGLLWLMGGAAVNGPLLNDVWSSADGNTWKQVSAAAPWSARSHFGCIGFGGKIWVMGGLDASGKPLSDVWSSEDGVTWTQVKTTAPWSARSNFGLAEFNGAMYVVCGLLSGNAVTKDIWHSTNGDVWTPDPLSGSLSPRYNPCVATLIDRLYIAGGTDASGQPLSDLLYMAINGNWVVQSGIIQTPPPQQAACVQYQNALWIAGGKLGTGGQVNRTVLYYFPKR